MQTEQLILFVILATTVGLFLWGRWRHDVVALASLLACVLAGLVPAADAFAGFGHPAVITVAAVLVLSRGLQNTGAVNVLAQRLLAPEAGATLSIAVLIGVGAVLSAFMNNVGAMALLIPVAVQTASRHELPPGKVLMPLAFGTLLGGMTTLIGTPPNLIVSSFRKGTGAGSFGMFDFTPVGLAVALGGVLFLAVLGWRIVPHRETRGAASFDTGNYLTEAWVTADGKAVGKHLHEIERALEAADAQVVGMVRNAFRVTAPNPWRILREGDILVIEADPESLTTALADLGLSLQAPEKDEGDKPKRRKDDDEKKSSDADETQLQELVVMPTSSLIGRSIGNLHIGTRFGLNLLAISRQGRQSIKRLRSTAIRAGDVLLMQGTPEALGAFAGSFGGVPLAPRDIAMPNRGRATVAVGIMALAIAGAAFGLLPAAIAFAGAVLAFVVLRIVTPDKLFDAVDWPVVVLLGALIPVAGAMASTGAADALAQALLGGIAQGHPVVALALILIVTMTLSDFMNNAATAAVMCPIAISVAGQLGAAPDAFLMAVAIGGSCAFLTPIGHQNNTLILGPGGFRFGDYWRLGLPMEVLVVTTSVPMLLWVWPL